ncbi:tumor necrosis factor receptor superfamily member 14 isoform X2 [Lissotriton helveticus]
MRLLYFASLMVIFWKGVAHAQDSLCDSGEYLINEICCPMCDSGNRVQRPCTATTSGATSCIPCMPGTYMDHPSGLTECFKCKSCDPGSGLRVKSDCTYTRNTVCSCMDGYYCLNPATEDCDLCERHTVCGAGQKVKVPGTERGNTICEKCPTGTFSNQNMSSSCFTWTSCGALGRQEKEPGSHLQDAECGDRIRSRTGLIALGVVSVVLIITLTLVYECRNKRNTEVPRGNKWEEGSLKKTETGIPVECTERPTQMRPASETAKPERCGGWGREDEDNESGSEVKIQQQCKKSS